jgi:hypothetical protein
MGIAGIFPYLHVSFYKPDLFSVSPFVELRTLSDHKYELLPGFVSSITPSQYYGFSFSAYRSFQPMLIGSNYFYDGESYLEFDYSIFSNLRITKSMKNHYPTVAIGIKRRVIDKMRIAYLQVSYQ